MKIKMRDELIKTGALTAFQTVESGYITTKKEREVLTLAYMLISGILKDNIMTTPLKLIAE